MSLDAGSAVLDVLPGLDNFARQLRAKLEPTLRAATSEIRIDPGTKNFGRQLRADTEPAINKVADHAQNRLGGAFTKIIGLAAGIGGAFAAVDFFHGAFTEAEESRKTLALTQNVIKSTGGVAKVSATDVGSLADRLSLLSGIDDEVIAQNENMLLTFTNVRNEVGKGNDIFNQASAAVSDMAVFMNKGVVEGADFKATAIQIGKALQDPIHGVTSLRRVGVALTEQQQEQVKAFVASGDQLSAQKLILAELQREFGGAAAAATSPIEKLRVAWKNIEEQVGTALMPTIQRLATFLAESLPAAVDGVSSAVGWLHASWDALVGGFENPDASIGASVGGIEGFFLHAGAVVGATVAGIRTAWDDMAGGFQNADASIAPSVSGFEATFLRIGQAVRIVTDWLTTNVPIAFAAVSAWVQENQGTFERWGAKLQEIFGRIGAILSAAFTIIVAIISVAVAVISDLWDRFGSHLWEHIRTAFDAILQTVGGVLQVIQGVFDVFAGIFTGDWARVWSGIKDIFGGIWNIIEGILEGALNWISFAIGAAMAVISAIWGAAWAAVQAVGSAAWEEIKGEVGASIGWVSDTISGVLGGIEETWNRVWGGMRDGLGGIWDGIKGAVQAGVDGLKSLLNDILIDPANTLLHVLPGGLNIPRFASGGQVPGSGNGDTVPAWLTPGEFVMRKSAVQAIGVDTLAQMNAQRFADGGFVGGVISGAGNAVSSVVGDVGDLLSKIAKVGARALFAPIKAAANAALDALPWQDTTVGKVPPGIGHKALDAIERLIGDKDDARPKAGGATGSGYGWQAITHYLDMMGQPYQITSTTGGGHVAGSRHYAGAAVDLVGDMPAIAQTLMGALPALFELIHNPGFSVKRGEIVDPSFWGAEWGQHLDHVHASSYLPGEGGPGFPTGGPGDVAAAAAGVFGGTSNADRDWIIQRESGGDVNARNPSSGAFGLGQLNPSSGTLQEYAARFGFDPYTTDRGQQLTMMDAYVADRYGSYAAARAFWEAHGWYGLGGLVSMHDGGTVPGRTGDEVLAMLQAGETVTPVDAGGAPPTADVIGRAVASAIEGMSIVVNDQVLGEVTSRALHQRELALR